MLQLALDKIQLHTFVGVVPNLLILADTGLLLFEILPVALLLLLK